jgi:hypothetical protein
MLLSEAIRDLDKLPEDATLFAERVEGHFAPTSQVLSIELTDEERATPVVEVAARRAPGKHYFLEVFVAREALAGWRSMRGVERLPPEEATRVVIHYAENDVWPQHRAG